MSEIGDREAYCPHLGRTLSVSDHAVERFVARHSGGAPRRPMGAIRKLLARARAERMDESTRFRRLLSNRGVEAEYLVEGGWRFVVAGYVVTTVERTRPELNHRWKAERSST